MRDPACSGKESGLHPRCGGKPRCVLARGARPAAAERCQRASRMNGVCAGVHPQGGMHGGGRPRAGPPDPRPAPLTELHQRVEEAGDRHQEVGEKHVLQLQLHGRAAAGVGAGGVRQGLRLPAPRPPAGPAPEAAPPRAPPSSSSSWSQLPGAAAGGTHRGPLPVSLQTSAPLLLVSGPISQFWEPREWVTSYPACQTRVARSRKPGRSTWSNFENFPLNCSPCADFLLIFINSFIRQSQHPVTIAQ